MFAVRLDKELIKQVDFVAKKRHSNRSSIMRAALIRYLEDLEDHELADYSRKNMKSTTTLKKLRKELGLESEDK